MQTRSDLYLGTGAAELSLPWEAVPGRWGQGAAGDAQPGRVQHHPQRDQLGLFLPRVKPGGLQEGSGGSAEEPTLRWGRGAAQGRPQGPPSGKEQTSFCCIPSSPSWKADVGLCQQLALPQTSPCQAQQRPRGDATCVC